MSAVSVIEYGIGNIQSVVNACQRVGARPRIARTGRDLLDHNPDYIVLPGVGAAGEALKNLRELGLEDALASLVIGRRVPFLGICVGMQMLGEVCEEFGTHRGLGWIPGRVRQLTPHDPKLRLPHVGWNTIDVCKHGDDPLAGIGGKDAYFVHSYALDCPRDFVLATTDYGGPFVSAVQRGHIVGVQFHPEKSSGIGEGLLAAFLKPSRH